MQARMLRGLRFSLVALVLASLTPAAIARAATVTVRPQSDESHEAYYVAAPGEMNDVFAVVISDGGMRITDPGASITARGRCRSVDVHSAICRGDLRSAHIEVGDLDDRVATPRRIRSDAALTIDGGPGNDSLYGGNEDVVFRGGDGDDRLYASGGFDELHGGSGNDQLYGGGENDALDGGGGQDQLYGGPSEDKLTDGDHDGMAGDAAPGPDLLDGGDGFDTLSYEGRSQPVYVRVGVNVNAGEAGERDSISGIESLAGGSGDDWLVGDQQPNRLFGSGGNDLLEGRGKFDILVGGRGDDRLLGGPSTDRMEGGAGLDMLACGGGADYLLAPDVREILPRSCEQVQFACCSGGEEWVHVYPTNPAPRELRFHIDCPMIYEGSDIRCRGAIALRETGGRHRLLGRGRFRHRRGGSQTFAAPVALTSLGSRWWAGRLGSAAATVTLRIITEETPRGPFRWTITTASP